MRILGVIVFCAVFYVLHLTSTARHTRSPDFYSKTKEALDRGGGPYHPHSPPRGTGVDNEDEALAIALANRLKEAEQAAKNNANAKSPKPSGFDAGREKAKPTEDTAPEKAASDTKQEALRKEGNAEDNDVELEMNQILKRSPSESMLFADSSVSRIQIR